MTTRASAVLTNLRKDEFLEKFQTAFDPPSFLEKFIAIVFMIDMVAYMRGDMMAG